MKTSFVLFISLILGGIVGMRANNLTITNTSVSGTNITFQISWENSWNTNVAPNNWDAAWVFVKYQDCNTKLWNHASLSTTVGDHSAASPLMVETVGDGKGVFLRRSAVGSGNISNASITLKMTIPAGTYNYKVFGLEMVSVPQGTFNLGGVGSESTRYNSIVVDATAQSSGLSAASLGGSSVAIPNTYPMGYNALYCMKYELTQLQYVDFLNTLTYPQQATRTDYDPISAAYTHAFSTQAGSSYNNRNGIIILTPGSNAAIPAVYANDLTSTIENNSDDGQNIACNFLSPMDLYAYLDWAALRPMSDMEYEKICRGPMPAVANEYAWGSTNIYQVYNTLGGMTNVNTTSEKFSTVSNGRCAYGLGNANVAYGPLRVGIFAESTTGRESSGATYYGVMEMSGNLYENIVSTRNAAGAAYTGNNGDGNLSTNGEANQTSWPTTSGMGIRGGDWYNAAIYSRLADRTNSQWNNPNSRNYNVGGRGVR